jgi:hypothetical protein
MDERAAATSNEAIVDSLTLNDLENTDLAEQLGGSVTPTATSRSGPK